MCWPQTLGLFLGALVGGLYGAFGTTYKVDPFWGDFRALQQVIGTIVFAAVGAVLGSVVGTLIAAALAGRAAALEYDRQPPPPNATPSSKAWYIARAPLLVLSPLFLMLSYLWLRPLVGSIFASPPAVMPPLAARPRVTPSRAPSPPPSPTTAAAQPQVNTVLSTPALVPSPSPAPAVIPPALQPALIKAQDELPLLLGDWYSPGAQIWPVSSQPRPEVAYSLCMLLTRDDVETVANYYASRTSLLQRQTGTFLGRGPRPGDHRDTMVRVQRRDEFTYIEFSSS